MSKQIIIDDLSQIIESDDLVELVYEKRKKKLLKLGFMSLYFVLIVATLFII